MFNHYHCNKFEIIRKLIILPLFVVAGSASAQSGIWEIVPEVSLFGETMQNPRLRPEDPEQNRDSTRAIVDANIRLTGTGRRGRTTFEPRARLDRYSETENEELESDDVYLRAEGEYSWQRVDAGFQSRFARESIRTSEIIEAIPGDPDIIDPDPVETGELQFFDERRGRSIIQPYVQLQFSERTGLRFEAEYQDVSYSDPEAINRSDFQETTFRAGLVRQTGDFNEVTADFLVSSFEADLTANATDTVGIEGQFTHRLSDIWSLGVTAGVMRNDFVYVDEGETIDNADSTPIVGLNFRRRGERTTVNIDVDQRVTPSASGFLVERKQIRSYIDRLLTPRVTGSVGVRFMETTTLGRARLGESREDTRAEFAISWAISENLSLDAQYTFSSREFLNRPNADADANALRVGITYRGLTRLNR